MTTYQIPEDTQETFNFSPPNSDEVYSIPLLTKLPISLLLKVRDYSKKIEKNKGKLDNLDFLAFMSEIFDPYAPGVVGSLSADQAAFLFKEWEDASNEGISSSPMGE